MGSLFNNQFLVSFAFFSEPEHPIGVFLHIIDILPGAGVLLAGKGDGEAGFYFVCIHSNEKITIVMPFAIYC